MIDTGVFVTMTELGRRYGTTAHRVGKILKDWGYRYENGTPSILAEEEGMVEKRTLEDRPWIPHWAWHAAKTSEILEYAGLTPTEG